MAIEQKTIDDVLNGLEIFEGWVQEKYNRKGYTNKRQLKIHMYALQDQINDVMESYLNNNHTHFRLDGKLQTLETQLQVIAGQAIIVLQKYKDIKGERS